MVPITTMQITTFGTPNAMRIEQTEIICEGGRRKTTKIDVFGDTGCYLGNIEPKNFKYFYEIIASLYDKIVTNEG